MRKEYDFSKGVRGRFYRPDAEAYIPIYLERNVAKAVRALAEEKRTAMAIIVNEVLRKSLRPKRKGRSKRPF